MKKAIEEGSTPVREQGYRYRLRKVSKIILPFSRKHPLTAYEESRWYINTINDLCGGLLP